MLKRILFIIGSLLILIFILFSLFPSAFAPYELKEMDEPWLKCSKTHLLGTNKLGYDILTEISDYDSKLTPYDYDEFEFMIMICGDCIEVFKYNFEETKFEANVQNKMYQLIEKYITCLERNTGFGIQQKIQK